LKIQNKKKNKTLNQKHKKTEKNLIWFDDKMKINMNKYLKEAIKINLNYCKDKIQTYKRHNKSESRVAIK
jgi:hypothetical protein